MADDGDQPDPVPVFAASIGFRCPDCGSPVEHSPHPWIDVNGLSMDEVCWGVPIEVVIAPIMAAITAWYAPQSNGMFEAWGPVDGHPLGHIHDEIRMRAFVVPVRHDEEEVVTEDHDQGDDAA